MQIFLQINNRIVFRGQIWERVSDVLDEIDDEDPALTGDGSEFGFQLARTNLRDDNPLESFEDDDESEDDPDEEDQHKPRRGRHRKPKGTRAKASRRRRST